MWLSHLSLLLLCSIGDTDKCMIPSVFSRSRLYFGWIILDWRESGRWVQLIICLENGLAKCPDFLEVYFTRMTYKVSRSTWKFKIWRNYLQLCCDRSILYLVMEIRNIGYCRNQTTNFGVFKIWDQRLLQNC